MIKEKSSYKLVKEFLIYLYLIDFNEESTVKEIYYDIKIFYIYLIIKLKGKTKNEIILLSNKSIFNLINLNDLNSLDFNNLCDFIKYLKEERKLYSTSCNRKIYSIKKYSYYLFKEKYIYFNFGLFLEYGEKPKREPKYLSLNETKKILKLSNQFNLNNIKSERKKMLKVRNNLILEMFLKLGLRCQELINIKISDINFKEHTILINGKGGRQRLLYLNNYLIRKIKRYLNLRNFNLKLKQNPYLFLSTQKNKYTKNIERISKREVQYIVKNYFKKIDRGELSTHKLRTTFVNNLYNKLLDKNIKPNIEIISKILRS